MAFSPREIFSANTKARVLNNYRYTDCIGIEQRDKPCSRIKRWTPTFCKRREGDFFQRQAVEDFFYGFSDIP